MRILSTRAHGVIDYATGLLLIVAPYLFGFANGGAAQWTPMVVGIALIGLSLMTDYELALVRMIPMPVHLATDVAAGLLLAISPWLFGFADRVYLPHLIVGLLEIGAGLMTQTRSETSRLTARSV
jgi:hypothetical protein